MVTSVAAELHDVMGEVRARTLKLVSHLDDAQLEAVHSPIMSPLAWDLGHVAAYEDLWINHRVAGRELLRPGLAELYDAFETPRAVRGDLEFLRGDELLAYLRDVRERSLEAPLENGGELHELVIRHELQHTETMLQTMALAELLPPGFAPPTSDASGLELVTIPAGPATIGAGADGFAYDNERPRFEIELPEFSIGRVPVTGADWAAFVEDGGYRRREWWSSEGWEWVQDAEPRSGAAAAPIVTSPTSRPTRSPARAKLGFPRSSSGRKRRSPARSPVSTKCGSGPRASSVRMTGSGPTPIGSTPRCSSTRATGCCVAVRTPRIRGWPHRTFATGTFRNAASFSPE